MPLRFALWAVRMRLTTCDGVVVCGWGLGVCWTWQTVRATSLLCVHAALGWSAMAARRAFAFCVVGSAHASDNV